MTNLEIKGVFFSTAPYEYKVYGLSGGYSIVYTLCKDKDLYWKKTPGWTMFRTEQDTKRWCLKSSVPYLGRSELNDIIPFSQGAFEKAMETLGEYHVD